jgi:alkylation response protein AidB-like acyl-CoA dehydrogenase
MMEALGYGLVVEPVLSRIGLAARILDGCAPAMDNATLLGDIISGRRAVALAHRDHDRQSPAIVDAAGRLTGKKSFVLDAGGIDVLLVTCRTGDGALKLALVSPDDDGVCMETFRLTDGSLAADIGFDHVAIDEKNIAACAQAHLDHAFAFAAVAACAEMLGIMQRLLDDTVAYVQDRQQFGKAIGKFQAVQHRAARMFIAVEQSRSLVLNGWPVLLCRSGGLKAVINRCSHQSATLAEGRVRRGIVMCPLHGARFELASGRCIGAPYAALRTFPTSVIDGVIHVEVPDERPDENITATNISGAEISG